MDAYLTDVSNLGYSNLPPVLIAGSSEPASARARRGISALGMRIGAELPLDGLRERLEFQANASVVWMELDRDCGGAMDELLSKVSRDVAEGRYAAVVSTSAELVDPVSALIESNEVEFIVDADEAERTAALAIAMARRSMRGGLSDIASEKSAERLRQLSEEVSRIASTLARLSAGPAPTLRATESTAPADVPALSVDIVRNVIRARRLRARYFSQELFADPAWDMLLDLLQAEIAQLRVPVSSLCIAAAVPATTALRWLKTMVAEGLFVRRADPHDGRRVFVELAPEASSALRRYFADVGKVAVI